LFDSIFRLVARLAALSEKARRQSRLGLQEIQAVRRFFGKSKKAFAFKSYRLYILLTHDPNRRLAMTAAFAPTVADLSDSPLSAPSGAQNLLTLKPARQFYLAEAAAIALYALALSAGLHYKSHPVEAPPEDPIELVMEPAVAPEPPPPPPPELAQPQPEEIIPPPPAAIEPAVAPVEPEKPKPIVKPKPKPLPKAAPKPQPVHERVEHKPQAQPQQAARTQAAAAAKPVPAGATASVIANQIHGCLARAGAALYPENQKPRAAHVGYHASISASGSVSYSWSPSGNPAFDSAAQRAASRCGHVDAPGHPASFSGAINFTYR
jgi:periplasmic protein TonB